MTQKDISLYYNVNVYIIFFPQKCHFQIISHFLNYILQEKKNIDYIILKHFLVLHTHHIHFKFYPMFPQYIKNTFI